MRPFQPGDSNMLDLAIGSTWRNRCGQFVTVEYKASQRYWYMRHESSDGSGYMVDLSGRCSNHHRPDLSLMERAPRVYLAAPADVAHDAREMYRKRGCWVIGSMPNTRDSLRALLACEMIVLLPGYDAMLELHVAQALGMAVVWPE